MVIPYDVVQKEQSLLTEKLKNRIIQEGSLTYEAFIDTALYDKDCGYYRAGKQDRLDYLTSVEIHSTFGALLGRYIEKQCTDSCVADPTIVELGGASGRLARDILRGFTCLKPKQYFIIENGIEQKEGIIQWLTSIDDLPSGECAFIIAHEMFDALPFHRIVNLNGVVREMYIDWDHGFYEKPGPLSHDVESFLMNYPIYLPSGQIIEVTTAALNLVRNLSEKVHTGYFLIFDYGYHTTSIEAGAFADGSALGYRNRLINEDILNDPGKMDITHHVNFDHLSDLLKDYGWNKAGEIEQYRFLINGGILENLMALSDEERLRAKWLINPEGLGSMVSVLGFSKGVSGTMSGFGKM